MNTQDSRPLTILLVDDDLDCRMLIHDALTSSHSDAEVFEVGSGEDAIEFLSHCGEHSVASRPSLIYLDVEMPGMGGLEALRRIRARRDLRDVPIVMMTGVCDPEQMKQAAQFGANSYTLKPANAEQFLRMVQASMNYWLTIHQYPEHHIPAEACRS